MNPYLMTVVVARRLAEDRELAATSRMLKEAGITSRQRRRKGRLWGLLFPWLSRPARLGEAARTARL